MKNLKFIVAFTFVLMFSYVTANGDQKEIQIEKIVVENNSQVIDSE